MAFTFNRTDFVQARDYNEQEHAKALTSITPNFITKGLDFVAQELTPGFGNNNGVAFQLGITGETEPIVETSGYIIIKTVLDGLNSVTSVITSATIPDNTDTEKYFAIYELDGLGGIANDFRYSTYVPTNELALDNTEIFSTVNGTESNKLDLAPIIAGVAEQRLLNTSEAGGDVISGYTGNSELQFAKAVFELQKRRTEVGLMIYVIGAGTPNFSTYLNDYLGFPYATLLFRHTSNLSAGGYLDIYPNNGTEVYTFRTDNFGTLPTNPQDLLLASDFLRYPSFAQSLFATDKVQGGTFTVKNWKDYEKISFRTKFIDDVTTGGLFLDVFLNINDGKQHGHSVLRNTSTGGSPIQTVFYVKLSVTTDGNGDGLFIIEDTQKFSTQTSGFTTDEFKLASGEARGKNQMNRY